MLKVCVGTKNKSSRILGCSLFCAVGLCCKLYLNKLIWTETIRLIFRMCKIAKLIRKYARRTNRGFYVAMRVTINPIVNIRI